jgi:hypothetical protein
VAAATVFLKENIPVIRKDVSQTVQEGAEAHQAVAAHLPAEAAADLPPAGAADNHAA